MPPVQPPTLPVHTGDFHRLGLVTDRPGDEVTAWFTRVLGASPNRLPMPAVRGFPRDFEEHGQGGVESGATSEVLWVGDTPVAIFVPTGPDSPVAGFLSRYGPGVHSLAWTVDDLWTVESLLRRHGVRITGTDIAGRHMFMHPRDSAGVLIEWTDTDFAGDPRHSGPVPPTTGAVPVLGLAWVTAVVRDVAASTQVLQTLMTADERPDGIAPGAKSVDLLVSGLRLRLIAPAGPESRWQGVLDGGGERLASLTWAVEDLDSTERRLADAGIAVTGRAGAVLSTDPRDTLGLHMDWAQRPGG
jgi:hypothetical protein